VKLRSIGSRLTLWYSAALALSVLVFAAAMFAALRHSLYHAVDDSLRARAGGLREFLGAHAGRRSREHIREELEEYAPLSPGAFPFQVADENGRWLYRSAGLESLALADGAPAPPDAAPRLENLQLQGEPFRLLTWRVEAGGGSYQIQVAAPLHELQEGLEDFLWVLVPAAPLILVAAAGGGYWISQRALRPVDEVMRAARRIGAENLSERLAVPRTGDEIERLSETLNEMIARLESAFQKVTRFTADASHELRTPLALIRTTAEVALRGGQANGESREALEHIAAEVERTSGLVDNLLLIARADSGALQLRRTETDLASCAAEACSQASPLAQWKKLKLECRPPERALPVEGDPEALRRLFLILIDNAVKYTPVGGEVRLSLAKDGDRALGVVEDTGPGIPATDLPHIFERFYRVDKARSREQGGAGLGLSIARWIAETHAGEIHASSPPGAGARFEVRLPLRAAQAGGDSSKTETHAQPSGVPAQRRANHANTARS